MILKHNSAKKTYFILSLSAGAIIFLASIAGTYIVSGIQKVSPQNMLGRVMAIFATINNCALPIGVWLYGIIYARGENCIGKRTLPKSAARSFFALK
jgi:hypothetical protein